MIIIFDAPTYELTSSKYDGIFKDIPMSFTTEERLVDGTVTVVPALTESLLKKVNELDPSGYCIYVFACSRNKRKLKQYDKWLLKYNTSSSLLNASKMPDSEAADEMSVITRKYIGYSTRHFGRCCYLNKPRPAPHKFGFNEILELFLRTRCRHRLPPRWRLSSTLLIRR